MDRYDKLPQELQKHVRGGKGESMLDGYLRFLTLSESERYESLGQSWSGWQESIPFAVTAFGDLLAWTEDGYIMMYRFLENKAQIILSGATFFDVNINDPDYQKDFFDLDLFKQARRNIGPLRAEESYIFEPIPALGGAKESLYLSNTGKTWEYLNYVISMC